MTLRATSAGAFAATLIGMACLSVVSASAAPRPDDGYALRPIYKAGQSARYHTVIDTETQTTAGTVKTEYVFDTTDTVRDAKAGGAVTLDTRLDSGAIKTGGLDIPMPGAGERYAVTLDAKGSVTKVERFDKDGNLLTPQAAGDPTKPHAPLQLLDLPRLVLRPDHPLAIGESYRYDFKSGTDNKDRMTGAITLVRRDRTAEGAEALQVHNVGDVTTGSAALGEQRLHIDATSLIDPSDFQTLSVQGKVTGANVAQQGTANMSIAFTRTRLAGH